MSASPPSPPPPPPSHCPASGVSTVSIGYLAVAMKGGTFADLASAVEGVQQFPVVWTTGKFVMALPICYHLINGVRHLVSEK